MGQLVFQATAGGQTALIGPNPSTNFSLNVPAINGTLITSGDTGTVTNTMLASSAYTAPGTIGSGTPNTGAFTTLSASSTVSGAGFSNYLASPPSIGGTAANTGTFTTVTLGGNTQNQKLGAKNASTLQNRLINAGFGINQRVYVSGTALAAGIYAHDRWKAGASGCTYTFTQGSLGVPIVITITAGSLQQVIEGCNMPEGGTYVLSWTGTAQARFNGGSYSSSPLAVTGITAGANTTIEFNTGTLSFPQLEVGSFATGFEYRQYGQELALCQRYYWQISSNGATFHRFGLGMATATTSAQIIFNNPVQMRSSSLTLSYGGTLGLYDGNTITTVTALSYDVSNTIISDVNATVALGLIQFRPYELIANNSSTAFVSMSAEL